MKSALLIGLGVALAGCAEAQGYFHALPGVADPPGYWGAPPPPPRGYWAPPPPPRGYWAPPPAYRVPPAARPHLPWNCNAPSQYGHPGPYSCERRW